jgi:hypothetical protein
VIRFFTAVLSRWCVAAPRVLPVTTLSPDEMVGSSGRHPFYSPASVNARSAHLQPYMHIIWFYI